MAQEQSLAWLMENKPDSMTSLSFVLDPKLAGQDIFTLHFLPDGKFSGTYEMISKNGETEIENIVAIRPGLRERIAKLHLENWKPEGYFPRQMIMDGWSWSLEVRFEGYEPIRIEGVNELPENFQKLRSLFLRLFEKDYLAMLETLPDELLIERISDLYHSNPEFEALWNTDTEKWFEENELDASQEELAFMTKVKELKKRGLSYVPSKKEKDLDYQLENHPDDIKALIFTQDTPGSLREIFKAEPDGDGILLTRRISQDLLPIARRQKKITRITWNDLLHVFNLPAWAHPDIPKPEGAKDWNLVIYFKDNPQSFILRDQGLQPKSFQDSLVLLNELFLG